MIAFIEQKIRLHSRLIERWAPWCKTESPQMQGRVPSNVRPSSLWYQAESPSMPGRVPSDASPSPLPLLIGCKHYTQKFWVAEVTRPILGAEFINKNNLAIDLYRRFLVGSWFYTSINAATPIAVISLSLSSIRAPLHTPDEPQIAALLDKFPEILTPRFDAGRKWSRHGMAIFIPWRRFIPSLGVPNFFVTSVQGCKLNSNLC